MEDQIITVDLEEVLVPIVLFVAIAATYITKYYFAYRSRRDVQATIRTALERGQPLTPELLDHLEPGVSKKNRDLRRGTLWIAAGLALCAFAALLGEAEAFGPLLGTGAGIALFGIGHLVVWRAERDKSA